MKINDFLISVCCSLYLFDNDRELYDVAYDLASSKDITFVFYEDQEDQKTKEEISLQENEERKENS